MRNFFPILFAIIPSISLAEYRAFELEIRDPSTGASRRVITTLDHLQYPTYNFVKKADQIGIRATWMCRERSDYHKPICPNPNPPKDESKNPDQNAGQPALDQKK